MEQHDAETYNFLNLSYFYVNVSISAAKEDDPASLRLSAAYIYATRSHKSSGCLVTRDNRIWISAAALAGIIGTAFIWAGGPAIVSMAFQDISMKPTARLPAGSQARLPTLYCEFTNFTDQKPIVGFYFRVKGGQATAVYVLMSQRDQYGSTIEFGGEGVPPPQWAFDGSNSPAVIQAPEDGLQINLYNYDPVRPGTYWLEAGLRSNRYKNLGGRCRHSA